LGLSDEEFWNLTPIQLNALLHRFLEAQKRLDGRTALICAVLANIYRDPKKHEPFTIEDFMPGEKKPKKQTPEEMLEKIKAWNVMLGGKETKKQE
jgi:hypothetical protein